MAAGEIVSTSAQAASKATSLLGGNAMTSAIVAILPLVVVIYFMYQDNYSYSNLFGGMSIIFLIGMVAFLCGCSKEGMGKSALVTVAAILLYSIMATMTSINVKKSSKLKYFWVNGVIQYSLLINLALIMLGLSKVKNA